MTNPMGGRGAALLIFIFAGMITPAAAQSLPVVLPAGDAPVVRVMMRSGSLAIRTWNRSDVQVNSGQPVSARSFRPEAVARALNGSIPILATSVMSPGGPITLPPEEFALTSLSAGSHAGVLVQAQDADVTLMVPAGTALLLANVQRGLVNVQDYHGGAFVILVHNGGMRLQNVSGSGYAQVARGMILVGGSAFDHLRARTAVGNILFENCDSKQIEVSNVDGTIVYDNGTFQQGLARFESQNGNIAIGIARGPVQIGAHSSVGRIFSAFDRTSARPGQTDLQAGSGSTVVTASSSHGGVYLYNGALRSQKRLARQWSPIARFMKRRPPQPRSQGRIH